MLPHVHGGHAQPERAHRTNQGGEPAVGQQLALVGDQRGAHHLEIGQQGRAAAVVATLAVRHLVGQPAPGVDQLLPHAVQLQPVRLFDVNAPGVLVEFGQACQVVVQALLQLGGDPAQPAGGRHLGDHGIEGVQQHADAHQVLPVQHGQRGVGGDVGVAVAVAADPVAQGQRVGGDGQERALLGGLVGQVIKQPGHRVGHQRGPVEQNVAGLVLDGRLVEPQLVGLPQGLDDLLELPVAGTFGPRRQFGRSGQQRVADLAQLAERGATAGLGGVRGEHRTDLQL